MSFETYALVRDRVDADEQPSIAAKGIGREIRPFALRDFLESTNPDRFVQCEREGFLLRIDLDRVSDRQEAADQLARIIEQLKD